MYDITLYIVCASCSHYFDLWVQLYNSICDKAPYAIVHFYDLGLSPQQKEFVQILTKMGLARLHYHLFDFSKYPDWVHVSKNAGQWAWKAQCIKDVMDNHVKDKDKSIVNWSDSGNVIMDDLTELMFTVIENGIYSCVSSGTLEKWTRPQTLKYFNMEDKKHLIMRNAALPTFFLGKDWVREFINEYSRLSLVKECIYPKGSSRANHRQDQSVLSCLFYIYAERYRFNIVNNYIGIAIHCTPPGFQKPYSETETSRNIRSS